MEFLAFERQLALADEDVVGDARRGRKAAAIDAARAVEERRSMPNGFSRNPGLVESSSRSSYRESPMEVAVMGDNSSWRSKYSSTSE